MIFLIFALLFFSNLIEYTEFVRQPHFESTSLYYFFNISGLQGCFRDNVLLNVFVRCLIVSAVLTEDV